MTGCTEAERKGEGDGDAEKWGRRKFGGIEGGSTREKDTLYPPPTNV